MKFMSGRTIKGLLLTAVFSAMLMQSAQAAYVTEFNLSEADCGQQRIASSDGKAFLSASADGINPEKIRWDSDPAHMYPRMQGKNLATGWHEGGAWQIEFSTEVANELSLSAVMYSSGKGPRDFALYYSFDNVNYVKIENSEVKLTQEPQKAYDGFSLPSELDNRGLVYLKIMIDSDISVKGSSITGIKDGSTYINNICIASENGSGGNTPDTPADSSNENTAENGKIYYKIRTNSEYERIGKETGKYRFSIPIKFTNTEEEINLPHI